MTLNTLYLAVTVIAVQDRDLVLGGRGTMRLSSCSGQQGVCGGSPERWQSELQAWGSSNLTLINSFVCAQIGGGKAS